MLERGHMQDKKDERFANLIKTLKGFTITICFLILYIKDLCEEEWLMKLFQQDCEKTLVILNNA